MIDRINTSCPDACIVVVGTCLPNDKISWGINDSRSLLVYHKEYAPALEAEEENEGAVRLYRSFGFDTFPYIEFKKLT